MPRPSPCLICLPARNPHEMQDVARSAPAMEAPFCTALAGMPHILAFDCRRWSQFPSASPSHRSRGRLHPQNTFIWDGRSLHRQRLLTCSTAACSRARSYCWIFFAQLVACHMQTDASIPCRRKTRPACAGTFCCAATTLSLAGAGP